MSASGSNNVYRAALIGCGSMGSYCMDEIAGLRGRMILPFGHSEVLKTHSRTDLVAGADPDPKRLQDFGKRWEVDRLYSNHRQMLEAQRPEIVSIASPPSLHPQHIQDCVEAGVRGIFCEKPLCPTLGEADAILRACEAGGVSLSINHTRRGDPFVLRTRELLEHGEIGEVLSLSMTWPGRLFLSGTHFYDLANYFAGDCPTRWLIGHSEDPAAEMSVVPTQRGVDVGGTAYAVYQNGIRVFFNGRDGHSATRSEICGTEGVISWSGNDTRLWKRNRNSHFRELLQHPFPQMMRYTAPMLYLLEDLMEAIETGRDPLSNGGTGRHALEQILATHYSSQHDSCKVRFPLKDLDTRPPFQWFGEGGEAVDRSVAAGGAE